MSSLLGELVNQYNTSTDAPMVELRTLLGANKVYADLLPPNITKPFVMLAEAGTKVEAEPKSNAARVRVLGTTIDFTCYSTHRQFNEDCLELIEDAFCNATDPLELGARKDHMATFFVDRTLAFDGDEGWIGTIQLRYVYTKQPRI